MGPTTKHASNAPVILGIIAIALLAAGLVPSGCGKKTGTGPQAGPPPVTVARPQARELVDQDEYNGWIEAAATVDVRSRVRGHIDEVHFEAGALIEKDDPLFTLDRRPFQAELDAAAAQRKVYEAQEVAAEKDLVRLRELLQKGGSSQSQVDKAEADVGSLAAQIESARQQVERHRLDLEFASIAAPISGRIGRALLTAGNLVNAGGTDPVLATIVSVDPIYVYFNVDERSLQRYLKMVDAAGSQGEVKRLRDRNSPFSFGLESDDGFPRAGVLDFADIRIDRETGTIQMRGEVPNPDGALVPGSRARVRVPVSLPYERLLVPDTAVLTDQDRKYLLVVGPDGKVLRRDVELGRLQRDGMRIVTKGLQADHWVIVLGLQRARVHFPVTPLDADGKPVALTSAPAQSGAGAPPAETKED